MSSYSTLMSIKESKFEELKEAVDFLQKKAGHELAAGQEKEMESLQK